MHFLLHCSYYYVCRLLMFLRDRCTCNSIIIATPTNTGPGATVGSPKPNQDVKSGATRSNIHDEVQRNGKLSTTSSTSDIAGFDRTKPSISAEEASINSEASGQEETISKVSMYRISVRTYMYTFSVRDCSVYVICTRIIHKVNVCFALFQGSKICYAVPST